MGEDGPPRGVEGRAHGGGLLAIIASSVIILVAAYFLFRLPLEWLISRETFTIVYGVGALLIATPVLARLGPTRRLVPVLIYAAYLVARFVGGEHAELEAISLFQYLVPLGFYVIGMFLWRQGRYEKLIGWFVLATAASLAAGLVNYYTGWGDALFAVNDADLTLVADVAVRRCGSFAGNSIGTGFLAMAGALLAARRRWGRWLLPVYILAIFATLSRGALVMAVGGGCVWAVREAVIATNRRRARILWAGTAASVALLLVLTTGEDLWRDAFPMLRERFGADMFNFAEEGHLMRRVSWDAALEVWASAPLFGVGYGTLGASAVKRAATTLAPESMYLKILGEIGAVGLILYLTAIGNVLIPAWRQLTRHKDAADLPTALVACLLAILLGGVFLQNLEYDFFAVLFWYFLGGVAAWEAARRRRPRQYASLPVPWAPLRQRPMR